MTLTTWSALGWCRNVNEVCSSNTAAASTLRRSRRWEAKLSALAILIADIVTIRCRKVLYVATSLTFDICCYNCSNHIHSLVYIKNIHMYRSLGPSTPYFWPSFVYRIKVYLNEHPPWSKLCMANGALSLSVEKYILKRYAYQR